ncbi:MAG: hypothetical protein NDI63_07660 [Pseudobdellovibrio sp.]|nr:hypothetical protein [Pseudobdellovibrio sp.]
MAKSIVKKIASKIKAKVAVKPVAKAKPAAKTVVKAKVQAKVAVKPAAKPAPKAKVVLKKEAKPAVKKTEAPKKVEAKAVVAESVKPPKADAKLKTKSKKAEKKSTEDDDDFSFDDNFGDSEISDYEDDLKDVEEQDEEENLDLTDDEEEEQKDEEIYLTDSEGRRLCRVRDCDQVASVEGYCRYHYLLLWKKIQIRKSILQDGKLEKYVEDLTSRYPDKFLEMIKKDLKSEKEFLSAIQELEIDESALNEIDGNDEETQSFADEIRGIGEAPSMDEDGDY